MDRFCSYEENFLNSSRIISRALTQLSNSQGNAESVISLCVDIECELSEAEGFVRAMDVELRTLPSAEKRTTSTKVAEYKDEYKQLTQSYAKTKSSAEGEVLKSGSSNRSRLLNSNQRLDNTTASLEESRRILAQTEQIGGKVLGDMENQKETLIQAHVNVSETKEITADAGVVLEAMARRAFMHKLCVISIIVILAGLIGVTIFFGFIQNNQNQN